MNTGLKERLRVIAETADVALLEQPLRSLEDLEAIERVPLEERLKITDFCRRMDIALAAHDPAETAISGLAGTGEQVPPGM